MEIVVRSLDERAIDLKILNDRMNDWKLPLRSRKVAYNSYKKILRQMNDVKLRELRHRLARAAHAGDHDIIDKLEQQIRVHSRKMGY